MYHNVGGNFFRQENVRFLTWMAFTPPKTLRLKDLVSLVSMSSWWATCTWPIIKNRGKTGNKSQHYENEERDENDEKKYEDRKEEGVESLDF